MFNGYFFPLHSAFPSFVTGSSAKPCGINFDPSVYTEGNISGIRKATPDLHKYGHEKGLLKEQTDSNCNHMH